MNENEEFEFRLRAEQEAAANATQQPPAPRPVIPPAAPEPSAWEDAQAGIASTGSRLVRGIGTTFLPKSAEAFLERKGILPTEADVGQLHQMAGRSAAGTAAEVGTDIAASMLPIAKGAQLIRGAPLLNKAPRTAAYLGDIAANAGYNAMTSDDPAQAALVGGGAAAVARPVLSLAGKVAPKILGVTTAAGEAPIRTEFARGKAGLPTDMRSAEPAERISEAYLAARNKWAGGPQGSVVPAPIRQAYRAAVGELREGNIWKTPSDQRAVLAIGDQIDEVLSNPQNLTPVRVDALKQNLNDMVDNLHTPQAQKVMRRVVNATKESIDKSGLAPGYGEAMAETAARARALRGGEHPLSTWLPTKERFLPNPTSLSTVGLGGISTGLALGPKAAALAPLVSPRLVGESARAAGRVAGMAPQSGHAQLVNAVLAALRGEQGDQNAP